MSPQLINDPENYEPGTVAYHLAAAEWSIRMAHEVSDDEGYYAGEKHSEADWSLQHLHAAELAAMASAHAAIAQAKLAAGWVFE